MYTRTVSAVILMLLVIFLFWEGDSVHGVVVGPVNVGSGGEISVLISSPSGDEKVGTVINYSAVGDSIGAGVGASSTSNGYVERLAQFLATDNSATVTVDNRAVSGTTSSQLLAALQTDVAMRASIQSAQVITFNVGSNDFLAARNSYRASTCGGIDGQDCLRAANTQLKSNWDLIIQEILALRANISVDVRTFDLYYPFVNLDLNSDSFPGDGLNDFQVMRTYLDEANLHIRAATLSNGLGLGRVHRSFNGIDGASDPGLSFSILAGDGSHPNDLGHSVIADRLRNTVPICLQPQNGLTAWYRAENNANDSTANNNNATLENGTTFLSGKSGQGFSFDGVDDTVLLPTIALGDSYTVETWINPAPTQGDIFVNLASNAAFAPGEYGALELFTNTPGTPGSYRLRYVQGGTERILTGQTIQPGLWTHVALTHDSVGFSRLYIDGVLQGTSSASFVANYNHALRLGSSLIGAAATYSGRIDEVSLVNRALSSSEVAAIVDADNAARCVGSDLQIAPTTAMVNAGSSQTFTVTGGFSPYIFNISSNPPLHGSIDPITGQYDATSAGVDTVRVTDAAQFTSDAAVTVVGNDTVCPSGKKVWDGGGTTNNWNDAGNWCGNTIPGISENVTFDATSTKNATVNVNVTAASIDIAAAYTGTITVANLTNVTLSGGGSSTQAGGTFTNGSGTAIFGPAFSLTGGTFNSGSGTVNFNGGLTQSAGTFNGATALGSVNIGPFSDLTINGGIFNAPAVLTLNRHLSFNGGTFEHQSGRVVFASDGNALFGVASSEIVFSDLTINKGNGSAVVIFPQTDRIVRVVGELTLTEGLINGNTGSGIRAEAAVNINPTFGDPTLLPNPGGNAFVQFQNGPAGRIVSVPAGASLPDVVVNDPNVTINGLNVGTITTGKISLQRGVVGLGATSITTGVGVGTCFDQTGGSFSIGSGNFLCAGSFLLSQPDGANPSTFTGGTGNFTLASPGSSFHISGGTFTGPTGSTLINTGEFNNNFTQSGGTFNANGSFECQCAQFLLSGGTFNATSGTSTFRRNFNRTSGTFNANGGTVVLNATPGGSVVGNTTFNNLTIDYSGNNHQYGTVVLTVNGVLNLQNGTIDQGGTFDIKGNVQIASTFGGATSNVTFSGTGTQMYTNSGGGTPTGIWTINKPTGALNLNSHLDASVGTAAFNLTNGNIFTGANIVDTGLRDVNGSASSYILGNLRRSFPGGGLDRMLRYDLGSATGYAPVTVRVPNTPGPSGTSTPLRVSTIQMPHPLFDPASSLSFYWVIGEGIGLTNSDVTFIYPQAAVNGNEANYRVDRVDNGQIQILPNLITTTTNTVTLTGVNNLAAEWTMSELPLPLVLTGTSPATVDPGDQLHYTASGGRPPYQFSLAVNNSGASLNSGPSSTFYTAGSTTGVTDTLRLTDSLGTTQEALITVVDPFTVINTNDSGGGSLRQAIMNSNNAPGTQTITFHIPGTFSPHTINSGSPRRFDITDTVVIDGTTQTGTPTPFVEVRNAQFNLFSSNSTIKGLIINSVNGGITDHAGIYIGGNASGNTIQGNYIGTDVTGNFAMPNVIGVEVHGDSNIVVGNIISGNQSFGILVESLGSAATGNLIKNNRIGVGFNGSSILSNGDDGIRLHSAQGTLIGGQTSSDGNRIGRNHGSGISTQSFGSFQTIGNTIRANQIFLNDSAGIDLKPVGINANDGCDADAGDNRGQNYPDLTSVVSFGGSTIVDGTFNGEPNKIYTLDFYWTFDPDPSGFGGAEVYLGSGQVTTPAACGSPTAFSVTIPVPLAMNALVTATATDPDGSTSEFSANLGEQPADISGTILNSSSSPMKGVAIVLRDPTTGRTLRRASTDKTGRFKFANVPLGADYEVVPKLSNFVFVPASRTYNTVTKSHDDSYTGVVNNFSIGGHITMNGFSLNNVDVTLSGVINAAKKTNSTGDYSFDNLPSGTYTVSVSKVHVIFDPSTANFPTPITSNQTANFDGVSVLSTLPGRIIYADEDGNIKAMNPDGSGLMTIFPVTSQFTRFYTPRFSRNGSQVVFNNGFRRPNGSVDSELRVGSFDGSLRTPHLGASCYTPAISPNGAKVACINEHPFGPVGPTGIPTAYQIQVVNNPGGGFETITPLDESLNQTPDWKPDGSLIAFARYSGIYVIDPTTHVQTGFSVGQTLSVKGPRWSSDGTRFLFRRRFSTVNGPVESAATINTDGSNFQELPVGTVHSPVWAPNDGRIAFVRTLSGLQPIYQIMTTLPDGSDLLTIVPDAGYLTFIDWGPDNNVPTPAGTSTQISSGRVTITYPATSGPNKVTTITPIDPSTAGSTPGGFVVDGFAYEISTTANFVPPAEVCIDLHHLVEPSMAQFNAYTFMHNEGGVMVDRTSLRDFDARRICGSLPSFSPIALMKQVDVNLPSISGLVLHANGDPIDDVAVSISDDDTPVKTNHLGQFEFVNLKANTNYSVQIFKSGYLFSPPLQTFLNLTGDQTVVFTAVPANFAISGTVVNGANLPIAGVTVKLTGDVESNAVSGSDGSFTFPGLPANGAFTVSPVPNGTVSSPAEISIDALQSDLTSLVFTQFAPTAAGTSISGRITTADGRGIGGSTLVLTAQDGTVRNYVTGPFGYFRFDDVPSGETYLLDVSHKRYQFSDSPRTLSVIDELTDIDFIGSPRSEVPRRRSNH